MWVLFAGRGQVSLICTDPREARIDRLDRTGGPLNGNTYIRVFGKLFSDFTLQTQPLRQHLLRCRFSWVGETNATRISDTEIRCFSPPIRGTGHKQVVRVDITFNGQDFVFGTAPQFTYMPLDGYSQHGRCRDAFGTETSKLCMNNFTGVAVSELQPFGGPTAGNTRIVVIGRHFAVRGPSILCKFGNLSMVNATFMNESAVVCISPSNPVATGGFINNFVEVTLNGEENFLTDSRIPFVYYNHSQTLAVSAIYPRAGPKLGGNTITIYGGGFRVLGGILKSACTADNLTLSSEDAYGPGLTEGSLSQGLLKEDGDSRVCETTLAESTNRGMQCIFGSLPPVHAYLVKPDATPADKSVRGKVQQMRTKKPTTEGNYFPTSTEANV